MLNQRTAARVVETAVEAIRAEPDGFARLLDAIPTPLYVAANDGTITYANPACAELAGREAEIGRDKWCVTAKLYTLGGDELPHDECPMAVAIRERRSIRDVEAIAERPDGTRFQFVPFPTPLFTPAGDCVGAVNLLLDVTEQRTPDYLLGQAERCRRLAAGMTDPSISQPFLRMAERYEEQARK